MGHCDEAHPVARDALEARRTDVSHCHMNWITWKEREKIVKIHLAPGFTQAFQRPPGEEHGEA